MTLNRILGLGADYLFGYNHLLRAVRLRGGKLPIWYEPALPWGDCIDRRDISGFNRILVQL